MRRKTNSTARNRRSRRVSLDQLDWKIPYNSDNFVEPLTAEGIEAIHKTAMRILEEIGIIFLNEDACAFLEKAGCKVDKENMNVKMERTWVMEMIKNAPSEFTIFS